MRPFHAAAHTDAVCVSLSSVVARVDSDWLRVASGGDEVRAGSVGVRPPIAVRVP